jgi:large subunit ribosomal protein L9
MRVILKEDVAHVGNMGDIVKVADGYGRNYLIPQGLAELATEERTKAFAHQKALIDRKKAKLHAEALDLQAKLDGKEVKFKRASVKDETRIQGSVTNRDIAEALDGLGLGVEVDRRKIDLAQPIRELGEHEVEVKLAHDVVAKVKVIVEAE